MQTSRLELVRLAAHHVPGCHAIWPDPIATRWSPHGHCKDVEASEKWMSELLLDVNPLGENYAVLLRSDVDLRDNKKKTLKVIPCFRQVAFLVGSELRSQSQSRKLASFSIHRHGASDLRPKR
jgi:hypothetical protein